MNQNFEVTILKEHLHTKARVIEVKTAHGSFVSPVFMPVGTRAGVNNMTPWELKAAGSQIILGGNTYHMLCAPKMDVIQTMGGMHPFMGWDAPMLTDSGGFQVFSLSKNKQLCTIDEMGAHFTIPESGDVIHMTPEMSIETQRMIGADIIMAFDECTRDSATENEARAIMIRTHRWLKQSIQYHEDHPITPYGHFQTLFGIIQGGTHFNLREESAHFIVDKNLKGIAIGGESIGFDMQMTCDILSHIMPIIPKEKPRYTMGVGMSPQDLLDVVKHGIDMFDCVAPTRNARHGALYAGKVVKDGHWLRFESEYPDGRLQIKKAMFQYDETPILQDCRCGTCRYYSKAMLHQLFKQKSVLFSALATIHNIHVLHEVTKTMRTFILNPYFMD
jgi:queuine tRNA-ribosyltransferase